jgi:mono/diheme cytochrome c family protein
MSVQKAVLPIVVAWCMSSVGAGAEQVPARSEPAPDRAAVRSGEAIYQAACITCHGPDGTGSPKSVVGFDAPLPDFSDCGFATAEPDADWHIVVHEGGPIRALDRHMPAFGDALSPDEIALAVSHIRTFCKEPGWPQGDLNLPRAFFTEKAFPENEAVWETAVTSGDARVMTNDLIYERRLGRRSQLEVVVPVTFDGAGDDWVRGIGDIALAWKRAFVANHERGVIGAAGLEVILPTGNEDKGLGNGFTVFEPFAMWGQMLPRNAFLQLHGGAEFPTDSERGTTEFYLRTALGTTIAGDRGFGRAWSPQVEVLFAKPEDEPAEWDVVPQVQVTLSKLQHVMVAGGVRVPVTQRSERSTEILAYLLWDWFDGGFFEFWK